MRPICKRHDWLWKWDWMKSCPTHSSPFESGRTHYDAIESRREATKRPWPCLIGIEKRADTGEAVARNTERHLGHSTRVQETADVDETQRNWEKEREREREREPSISSVGFGSDKTSLTNLSLFSFLWLFWGTKKKDSKAGSGDPKARPTRQDASRPARPHHFYRP